MSKKWGLIEIYVEELFVIYVGQLRLGQLFSILSVYVSLEWTHSVREVLDVDQVFVLLDSIEQDSLHWDADVREWLEYLGGGLRVVCHRKLHGVTGAQNQPAGALKGGRGSERAGKS